MKETGQGNETLARCVLFLPKELIQGLVQHMADGKAELDGGIVVALFNGVDGLPGDANLLGQGLLR